ncbi:MAG: hypothetical protein RMM98_07255 [Acidobacteriota bacterium]|nr:hypothetical protein [Blastocatellia bacterium]MDW8239395.1 hypothetical protein [Acidobacteriota bacterium]
MIGLTNCNQRSSPASPADALEHSRIETDRASAGLVHLAGGAVLIE